MSWSFSVDGGPSDEFSTRAQAAADSWVAAHPTEATDEVKEQIAAAIEGAEALLTAVGTGDVAASLGGHATPGHEAPAGYSPDTLYVSVSRRVPQPA